MSLSRSAAMPRCVLLPAALLLSSMLGACGTTSQPGAYGRLTWAGAPIGPPPAPNPARKRAIIARANGEWQFFGRQTVLLRGRDESIPHVGDWEDDDALHSRRVNAYWRAAGHPEIDGMDCTKPWSAVFISWVMQRAGVPANQLQPAIAHWEYLAQSIEHAVLPGRWFVPRRVADYSPQPGDLICSTLGKRRARTIDGYISAERLRGSSTHCDLVVARRGRQLEAIGGNVRNSVSKVSVTLDGKGQLKRVPRRPWFMILQNRL
jgi:hypothetical protein